MDDAIAQGRGSWPAQVAVPASYVTDALEAYGPEVRSHLRAIVRDESDAEDLHQETFLRLHAELCEGRPPRDARAWLHRVAMNLAMSRGRHLQVRARVAPRLREWEDGLAADDAVIRREEHLRLKAALSTMSEQDREVLLFAAAGYSAAEIAGRLGRTPLATRTLLCRARARLRVILAEDTARAS